MRFWLIYLLLIFFLTSCGNIYFQESQPTKGLVLKTFYEDIQGVYSNGTLEVSISKKELMVGGLKFNLSKDATQINEVSVKYLRNIYYVNFIDDGYYQTFICKFYEDKLAVYSLYGDKYSINKIKNNTKIEVTRNEKNQSIINPSKSELNELIDNNFFEVVSVLKKDSNR